MSSSEHSQADARNRADSEVRERLEFALQGANLGTWDWHVPSDTVIFDECWATMLGYRLDEIHRVTPEQVREDASDVLAVLHPDDYDGVVASIQESATQLTTWDYEYRVKYEERVGSGHDHTHLPAAFVRWVRQLQQARET